MDRNMVTVIGLYGMSALFTVDTLPMAGETVQGCGLQFEGGGKGFNQAVSALRMGAQVRFVTAVGDDIYGSQVQAELRDTGFADGVCILKENTQTAFASVCVDRNGENIVIVYRGACDELSVEDIRALEPGVASSAVLLLQLEMPLGAVMEALDIAKKNGVYTILNPAPAAQLSRELLRQVDLITPNWGEALQITGLSGLQPGQAGLVAARLAEMGCKNVVITLGGDGAYVLDAQGNRAMLPAHKVVCVDSAGAGDTFNGAVAAGIGAGKSLADSVRYAMAAAALSVSRRMVVAAIPTLEEVEAFIQQFD